MPLLDGAYLPRSEFLILKILSMHSLPGVVRDNLFPIQNGNWDIHTEYYEIVA